MSFAGVLGTLDDDVYPFISTVIGRTQIQDQEYARYGIPPPRGLLIRGSFGMPNIEYIKLRAARG